MLLLFPQGIYSFVAYVILRMVGASGQSINGDVQKLDTPGSSQRTSESAVPDLVPLSSTMNATVVNGGSDSVVTTTIPNGNDDKVCRVLGNTNSWSCLFFLNRL